MPAWPKRKSYPSDVSDEEWAFVAPYLALVRRDTPQRRHDLLPEVFDALRWIVRAGARSWPTWTGATRARRRPAPPRRTASG